MVGITPRDLTLDDARALTRHPQVVRIAPLNVGAAEVSWEGRKREVSVWGSSHDLLELRRWSLAQGRFLPEGEWERGSPVAVIGSKVRDEIFGANRALGEQIRLGDRRFRVVGVLASQGRSIGLDVDEVVIIPVASAQALFNAPSLFRILIEVRSRPALPQVIDFVRSTITQRHQGEEDVTVITQDAVLATFDRVLGALTYAVGGIAAISLAVAGILIMNVMLVAVSQRTPEIGVMKALGATRNTILLVFVTEAAIMSAAGAAAGLALGYGATEVTGRLYPLLPITPPLWAAASAACLAIVLGLVFGVLPARRAAALDPVAALARR
jgi:putative ABC transport system permease protein